MNKKDFISIIIPVYGDKSLVRLLYDRLIVVLTKLNVNFEIIMVNDACPYGSGEEIEKLAKEDPRVKFIDFSRNFGQVYAIKAGFDYCSGDWVFVMDCDLQDLPEDIPRFYKKAQEGFDIVMGDRKTRKDNVIKQFFSSIYKFSMRWLSATKSEDCIYKRNIGTFSIVSKKVANEYKKINNFNSNYGSTLSWIGFKIGYIDIKKENRTVGTSSYNFIKGINLFVSLIVSNTNKPLIFAAYCSFLMFICCFIFVSKLIYNYYFLQAPLLGWTSIMVSLFFIASLIFAYLGILGMYIGGIFEETKKRPIYVIKNQLNLENTKKGQNVESN